MIVEKTSADRAVVQIPGIGNINAVTEMPKDTLVSLCIRPEHMTFLPDPASGAFNASRNAIRAKVDNVLYLGSTTQFSLSAPGAAKLLVDVVNAAVNPMKIGETVTVGFDPKDVSVLRRAP